MSNETKIVNTLQIFSNEMLKVNIRATVIDGEPWAVGKDVAEVLGYKDTKKALKQHVDEEDKQVISKKELQQMASEPKGGILAPIEMNSPRGLTFINEGGLYCLILRSTLPEAKKFRRWVTSDLLPTLRKTGKYEIKKEEEIKQIEEHYKQLATNQVCNAIADGYQIGEEEGYKKGRQDAYNELLTDVFNQAYNTAYKEAYEAGFKKGYATGINK